MKTSTPGVTSSEKSFIGSRTGKVGKVKRPRNHLPEYHRKTAENKYLEKIAEMQAPSSAHWTVGAVGLGALGAAGEAYDRLKKKVKKKATKGVLR